MRQDYSKLNELWIKLEEMVENGKWVTADFLHTYVELWDGFYFWNIDKTKGVSFCIGGVEEGSTVDIWFLEGKEENDTRYSRVESFRKIHMDSKQSLERFITLLKLDYLEENKEQDNSVDIDYYK